VIPRPPHPSDTPSRQPVLDWVRANAPDLRLGKKLEGDHRVCFARFTFAGVVYEFRASGEDYANPDDEIVRMCEAAQRKAMKLKPPPGRVQGPGLEQAIIAAELAGDPGEVAALTQELMTGRPREESRFQRIPTKWGTRTV